MFAFLTQVSACSALVSCHQREEEGGSGHPRGTNPACSHSAETCQGRLCTPGHGTRKAQQTQGTQNNFPGSCSPRKGHHLPSINQGAALPRENPRSGVFPHFPLPFRLQAAFQHPARRPLSISSSTAHGSPGERQEARRAIAPLWGGRCQRRRLRTWQPRS